jgi:hypothetical protein
LGTLCHMMFDIDAYGQPLLSYDSIIWNTSLLRPVEIGDHVNHFALSPGCSTLISYLFMIVGWIFDIGISA